MASPFRGAVVAVAIALGCATTHTVPDDGGGVDVLATCGDLMCADGETCINCSIDCGNCPACTLAPTCSNALALPANPTPRPDLYQGTTDPDAGADGGVPYSIPGQNGCQNPQLRLRLESVTTHSGGGVISCIVNADDGSTSEVAVTPQTKSLGDGETFFFAPDTSTFWGQNGLHVTTSNLTITYNCFIIVDNTAWASALTALGKAAQSAGGIAGPYGWAFGAASAASAAAAAAIQASNGAQLKLNAQQTIAATELTDLTNGRTWDIRETGGGLLSGWDWELTVESWGCAIGNGTTH